MSPTNDVKLNVEPPFLRGFFFFCEMLVVFCAFSCYTEFCKKFVCEVVFLWNKMNIQEALWYFLCLF